MLLHNDFLEFPYKGQGQVNNNYYTKNEEEARDTFLGNFFDLNSNDGHHIVLSHNFQPIPSQG